MSAEVTPSRKSFVHMFTRDVKLTGTIVDLVDLYPQCFLRLKLDLT